MRHNGQQDKNRVRIGTIYVYNVSYTDFRFSDMPYRSVGFYL